MVALKSGYLLAYAIQYLALDHLSLTIHTYGLKTDFVTEPMDDVTTFGKEL